MSQFDLIKFLDETNNEKDADKLFTLLQNACATVGLDRLVYSLMTPHETIGLDAGHAIVGNYPEDWMKHYKQKRYEQIDPVVKYAKSTEGIFKWSDLEKLGAISKESEKKVMDEAIEAGLCSGVAFSSKNYHGEIVGIGLASSYKNIEYDLSTMQFIMVISKQFDLNYKNILLEKKRKDKHLRLPVYSITPKQKDILSWIAKDKTYGEIALIMNISENTVHYHTKEIFKRLDVHTKMAAVLKAIKFKLIEP